MQDLTPQLRTRLSRVERAVGIFVLVATLLLLSGFGYYLWHTADKKGWFVTKVRYFTYVDTAAGLKLGTPVKLQGRDIGEITRLVAMPPFSTEGDIYVEFEVRAPDYGYLWTAGSQANVNAGDFLGNRYIEVTKGTNGVPTYVFWPMREVGVRNSDAAGELTNFVFAGNVEHPRENRRIANAVKPVTKEKLGEIAALGTNTVAVFDKRLERKLPTYVWNDQKGVYEPVTKTTVYYLLPRESPALTERLEQIASRVEGALPNVLQLTNRLEAVLVSANQALTNLNATISSARPVLAEATNALASLKPAVGEATNLLATLRPAISNVTVITANLSQAKGALGDWLIPTHLAGQLTQTLANVQTQLTQTLASAQTTITTANTALVSANKALLTADSTIGRASQTLENVDTNLTFLILSLNRSLDNLAGMTSNLNAQVQSNTNLVTEISSAIVHADGLMQGLKKHWLLRSAFKTNALPAKKLPVKSSSKP